MFEKKRVQGNRQRIGMLELEKSALVSLLTPFKIRKLAKLRFSFLCCFPSRALVTSVGWIRCSSHAQGKAAQLAYVCFVRGSYFSLHAESFPESAAISGAHFGVRSGTARRCGSCKLGAVFLSRYPIQRQESACWSRSVFRERSLTRTA